jgi:hypothetical protein
MIWIRKKNDKQNTTTKRTKMKYTKTNKAGKETYPGTANSLN